MLNEQWYRPVSTAAWDVLPGWQSGEDWSQLLKLQRCLPDSINNHHCRATRATGIVCTWEKLAINRLRERFAAAAGGVCSFVLKAYSIYYRRLYQQAGIYWFLCVSSHPRISCSIKLWDIQRFPITHKSTWPSVSQLSADSLLCSPRLLRTVFRSSTWSQSQVSQKFAQQQWVLTVLTVSVVFLLQPLTHQSGQSIQECASGG